MPSYSISMHALDRLRERMPALARVLPGGSRNADIAAIQLVARWLQRAKPMGQQLGFDLLVSCRLPTCEGVQTLIAAVRPLFDRDRWVVCTVFTPEMAAESVRLAQEQRRAFGRMCRGDRTTSDRRRVVRGIGRRGRCQR